MTGLWLNDDIRFLIRRERNDGGTEWRSKSFSFFSSIFQRISGLKSPTGVGDSFGGLRFTIKSIKSINTISFN